MIIRDAVVSLLLSAFELYIVYNFYSTMWAEKEARKSHKAVAFGVYGFLSILAVLPVLENYGLFLGLLGCLIIGLRFEMNILSRILCLFILFFIIAVSEATVMYLLVGITQSAVENIQNNFYLYISGEVLSEFVFLLIVKVIGVLEKGRKHTRVKREPIWVVLLPVCSCMIIYLTTLLLQYDTRATSIIVIVVIYSLLIFLNITFLSLLERLYQDKLKEKEWEMTQRSLKHENANYQAIIKQQIQNDRLMHDLRNQVIAVIGLLGDGQADTAKVKLEELTCITQQEGNTYAISDPCINAIVASKQKIIRDQNIQFTHLISLPKGMDIDSMDIAVIVGNILDNAIEACQKVENKRMIHIIVRQYQSYLCIKVENSSRAELLNKDLKTTKENPDAHGVGLETICSIVKKYGGDFLAEQDGDHFVTSAILPNESGYCENSHRTVMA